jgi:hypothetical protein
VPETILVQLHKGFFQEGIQHVFLNLEQDCSLVVSAPEANSRSVAVLDPVHYTAVFFSLVSCYTAIFAAMASMMGT